MTLINYLTRVHFADGVLEDALWAEMSRARHGRPLIVVDRRSGDGPNFERLMAGLPMRASPLIFGDCPPSPTEADALRFARLYVESARDCVIAFGGRAAIDFAKVARLLIPEIRPLEEIARRGAALAGPRPGAIDAAAGAPDLFVVPGTGGFSAAVTAFASAETLSGGRAVLTTRRLIPTVAICDPTLGLGAGAGDSAAAGAEAFLSCVEPCLSDSYNPPADGIAFDGLRRTLHHLPLLLRDDAPDHRREMAAAGLNGSLPQEKGPGVAFVLVNAHCALSRAAPDAGAVGRLVLPGVLRIGGGRPRDQRRRAVRDLLRLDGKDCLAEGVEAFLKPLPLPRALSELGVTDADCLRAAEEASRDLAVMRHPRRIEAEELHAVLTAVQ
ncbi:MAG: iron-containing alcohol dehydrogenase [Paracoccaceae bacterium]